MVWGCIAFVILNTTASALASTFQCTPIHKAWNAIPGSCINVNALFFANASLDIFQDAVIYVLPMRMLYHLQIPGRQKIALMGVFAVGGFVVITGMIRLNFLKEAQNTPDPSCKHILFHLQHRPLVVFPTPRAYILTDCTDNNSGGAIWSSIECNIGIVCASLPTFKALSDRFFPGLMGYRRTPVRNTPAEISTTGKKDLIRRVDQSAIELEHGCGWKDSYMNNYDGNCYSVTAGVKPAFQANSSEERLRGLEANDTENGGIWKSTSMMVSHGEGP